MKMKKKRREINEQVRNLTKRRNKEEKRTRGKINKEKKIITLRKEGRQEDKPTRRLNRGTKKKKDEEDKLNQTEEKTNGKTKVKKKRLKTKSRI